MDADASPTPSATIKSNAHSGAVEQGEAPCRFATFCGAFYVTVAYSSGTFRPVSSPITCRMFLIRDEDLRQGCH